MASLQQYPCHRKHGDYVVTIPLSSLQRAVPSAEVAGYSHLMLSRFSDQGSERALWEPFLTPNRDNRWADRMGVEDGSLPIRPVLTPGGQRLGPRPILLFMARLMTLSWRFLLILARERVRRLSWAVAPHPVGRAFEWGNALSALSTKHLSGQTQATSFSQKVSNDWFNEKRSWKDKKY